jgi:phosphoribosylaminoimidazolecarboxamide formyltransferase/IMP cyclohydrolase
MKKTCDIRRVLISVSNKEGIVELAHGLSELGVEILSTGGTSKTLRQVELRVKDVSDLTGFPEILDGRVKTLHPKVFGGLLSLRGKPSHTQDMEKYGIEPIDMVIVNLYPFESICGDTSLPEEELLEYMDIGGSALLRAASKNFRNVAPLVDPEDYAPGFGRTERAGNLGADHSAPIGAKAFGHTAHYDAVIASVFRQKAQVKEFPGRNRPSLRKKADLRYGENPHQKAALYQESGTRAWGVVGAKIFRESRCRSITIWTATRPGGWCLRSQTPRR